MGFPCGLYFTQASWPPLSEDFIFLLDPVSGHLGVQGIKTQHFIQCKCTTGSSLIKLPGSAHSIESCRDQSLGPWGLQDGLLLLPLPTLPCSGLSLHIVYGLATQEETVLALCLSLLTPLRPSQKILID